LSLLPSPLTAGTTAFRLFLLFFAAASAAATAIAGCCSVVKGLQQWGIVQQHVSIKQHHANNIMFLSKNIMQTTSVSIKKHHANNIMFLSNNIMFVSKNVIFLSKRIAPGQVKLWKTFVALALPLMV
jgi:hypothetical protein